LEECIVVIVEGSSVTVPKCELFFEFFWLTLGISGGILGTQQ